MRGSWRFLSCRGYRAARVGAAAEGFLWGHLQRRRRDVRRLRGGLPSLPTCSKEAYSLARGRLVIHAHAEVAVDARLEDAEAAAIIEVLAIEAVAQVLDAG